MKPRTKKPAPLGIVLGILLAGAITLPVPPAPSADNPAAGEADFELLTMEQAAAFSGAQSPWGCIETRRYMGCYRTDVLCGDFVTESTCVAAVAREYFLTKPTYCYGYVAGGGACILEEENVLCYSWYPCQWHYSGACIPAGGGGESRMDSYVCTSGSVQEDPPSTPAP